MAPRGLAVLGLVLTLVVGAGPAAATGEAPALVASDPAADAVLTAGADEVVLTFDRAVRPDDARLTVVAGTGDLVAVGAEPGPAGRTLTFTLPAPLGPGRHLVDWEVTTADGAGDTGAFVTVVDPTSGGGLTVTREVTAAPACEDGWRGALAAFGVVLLLAALLVVEAGTGRPVRRWLLTAAAVVAGGAALLAAGLAGLDPDGAVGDLAGAGPWGQAAGDGTGRWWLATALAVLLVPLVEAGAGARRSGRLARAGLALVLVTAAGLGLAAAGDARASGATVARAEASVGGDRVTVEVVPGRVGVDEVHVYGFGPGGEALDLDARAVALTHEATGVGPLEVPLTEVGPGHLIAPAADLPLAGRWSVALVPATAGAAPSASLDLEVLP